MTNKVVIFPAGKETEATAYQSWANGAFQALTSTGGLFADKVLDAFDQHVVQYLGPPFQWDFGSGLTEIAEPEGGEAARADGVLHDTWVPVIDDGWPD